MTGYFDTVSTDIDGRLFLPDIDPEDTVGWPASDSDPNYYPEGTFFERELMEDDEGEYERQFSSEYDTRNAYEDLLDTAYGDVYAGASETMTDWEV